MPTQREKRGYAESPFGQTHYRELGEGHPVLLLHQTAWSGIQFRGVMTEIASAGFKAIAPDNPGYGLSDGPDAEPTIEDYAAAIASLLRELGHARALVAGHHTGGYIGASLAAGQPELVAGLVMHAPTLYTDAERDELLSYPHFDQTPKEDGSHWLNRWSFARKATGGQATLEATQQSVMHFFNTGPTEWYGHHAVFKFDMAGALNAVKCPTLVMSNTGDMSHSKVPRTLEHRPDFGYVEIDGGTVYIAYEEPERWAAPVIEFARTLF